MEISCLGYTIYGIAFDGPYLFFESNLTVSGQYSPTVALYAGDDQGDVSGSIMGTTFANTYICIDILEMQLQDTIH